MDWPTGKYGVIYADPPWKFEHWGKTYVAGRDPERHYPVVPLEGILGLSVESLAAENCVLFLWATWPMLEHALATIRAWGFTYKTCAFDWMKADVRQMDMFRDDADVQMGLGYWTRANTEPCLLATRGQPKRLNADVRMGIISPRREHSRKPDDIYGRIERLVAGPYIELFARQRRENWDAWGNETERFSGGGLSRSDP